MEFLNKAEDEVAKPGWLSRRTVLKTAVKGCAALAAMAAGLRLDTAYAGNVACCNLAYPNNMCRQYNPCPCPDTAYEWTCKYNGCTIVCGECYACRCSYIYQTCSPGCPCAPGAPTSEAVFKFLPMRAAGTCH